MDAGMLDRLSLPRMLMVVVIGSYTLFSPDLISVGAVAGALLLSAVISSQIVKCPDRQLRRNMAGKHVYTDVTMCLMAAAGAAYALWDRLGSAGMVALILFFLVTIHRGHFVLLGWNYSVAVACVAAAALYIILYKNGVLSGEANDAFLAIVAVTAVCGIMVHGHRRVLVSLSATM